MLILISIDNRMALSNPILVNLFMLFVKLKFSKNGKKEPLTKGRVLNNLGLLDQISKR